MLHLLVLLATIFGSCSAECKGGQILARGLNCTEKQLIVDFHNVLRDKVAAGEVPTQPKAANMSEMRWSETAAIKAQEWSEKCLFEHDPDLEIDGELLGQNLAIKKSLEDELLEPDLERMIQRWFDEVDKYGYSGQFNPDSGHYSQLIWGTSNLVGCGLTYFKKQRRFQSLLVCDYIKAGNIANHQPYDYGPRNCEAYNMTNSEQYPHLCTTVDEEEYICNDE